MSIQTVLESTTQLCQIDNAINYSRVENDKYLTEI